MSDGLGVDASRVPQNRLVPSPVDLLSLDWWLADRRPGREGRVVGQRPNPSALVTYGALGLAGAARLAGQARVARSATLLGAGGSLVWSADELARGVNPFRRLVGAMTMVGTFLLIFRDVRR